MTPIEFLALKKVCAMNQSTVHNAHFRGPEDVAFLPEDFITPESRIQRQRQHAADKLEVAHLQQRLGSMKKGDKTDVPDWALEIN